ncbi:Helix-turn-helix domain [Mycobacteroides abscessus subsp. abscessus]|uniref:helix-turn-helix transcriptional regulator n=1 Tax=Mycobacteroides abscessus TaxID=36809 RepID=UPI0009CA630E|nr:helix-turn-helix domain-containing protein [Mycobacteroides abscessus]SLH66756.1 Helix-turn-helix domain [Mycobacteroides abscessus subsp. abscessus]
MAQTSPAPLTEAAVTDYLTPIQVSERLQVSRQTLSYWRARNRGPVSIQIGQAVRYPRAEFEAWLERQTADTARGEQVAV